MNQKDIKEIARMLKENYNVYPSDKLISELADYFERENRKSKGRPISKKKFYFDNFNKKQFLKDCGVSK